MLTQMCPLRTLSRAGFDGGSRGGDGQESALPVLMGILIGMPDTVTTIKVPRSLRERIAARAVQQRMTSAEVIAELLDEADRRARFEAVREAYASTDASYREETEAWDSLADDGLHP
jgi:hypothetical protein